MEAQYLLRFDDICPTMNWGVWHEIETILCDMGVQPILAIVPDNQDEVLRVSPPDAFFWERARSWQARGWTLAMHGWQHRFTTADGGMLGMNRFSEFAGLPRREQEHKLRCAQAVFEREGIESAMFIAPAHSFDAVTVAALKDLGVTYLCDGFGLLPHVDEFGMTWIPQQLWTFRRRLFGVWTICFHINRWSAKEVAWFRREIARYRGRVSSFTAVASRYGGRRKSILDSAAASAYRSASRLASFAKTMLHEPAALS